MERGYDEKDRKEEDEGDRARARKIKAMKNRCVEKKGEFA